MFGLFKKKEKPKEEPASLYKAVKPFTNDKKFFDKEKQDKFKEILTSKHKNNPCEICDGRDWTIATELVSPSIYYGKTLNRGLTTIAYPKAMIICTNCGNTKFFNAVVLGIEKQDNGDE